MRLSRFLHLTASARVADSLRVLLALAGVMIFSSVRDNPHEMIPLLLGVIAGGLAETDDSWRNRLSALLGTLICFALTAFAVELLFSWTWIFGITLALGSFVLVMLGAVSPRYGAIAYATLLLAVYTMIGMDHHTPDGNLWREPLLLVVGTAWYGLLALAWNAVFVHQPVRQALARLYDALSDYIICKSRLFEPVRCLDEDERRAELAPINARVVDALNDTRWTLVDRLNGRRSRSAMDENLSLYLAAQDIHERASSSHYPYRKLAQAFFHSDVMFRCQRLMRLTGEACGTRARSLRFGDRYGGAPAVVEALSDLRAAIDYLNTWRNAPDAELLRALEGVSGNVSALYRRIDGERATEREPDNTLQNPAPDSLRDVWRRILVQLTPASARLRHALRLGLAMLAGYIVLKLVHPREGYWILLTVMLVCQPSYGATTRRLVQRIAGTAQGLVAGWALLWLFPQTRAQLLLIVAAGVIFFATRFRHYLTASAAISVLVLLAFNQVGNGFDLIFPRLLDTVIGGFIAAGVMFLVLPDWREYELRQLLADALASDARYLREIFGQYLVGKRDDLAYRIARRDAHNADAAVSSHVATALQDPHGERADTERALHLLADSQTLIGYLSTLGAHRKVLPAHDCNVLLKQTVNYLAESLVDASSSLSHSKPLSVDEVRETELAGALRELPESLGDGHRLVAGQLRLLLEQLPKLRRLGQTLVR